MHVLPFLMRRFIASAVYITLLNIFYVYADNITIPVDFVNNKVVLSGSISVGGQPVTLALDTLSEGLKLFPTDTTSCTKISPSRLKCYDPLASDKASWCLNFHQTCSSLSEGPFICNTSKAPDLRFAAQYKQVVDGIIVYEMRLEGNDSVNLELGDKHITFNKDHFPVKLVMDRTIKFNSYLNVDGIWGIAGPSICCRDESLWNTVVEQVYSATGFDIVAPNTIKTPPEKYPSSITFSDDAYSIYSKEVSTTVWSERVQTGGVTFDSFMHFSTYDWQLCGNHVMHPVSTTWEAIVDLSSECLVVPFPLWEGIKRWISVDTADIRCSDAVPDSNMVLPPLRIDNAIVRRMCPLKVTEATPMNKLPALSFTLSQDSDKRISIPLEDLVIKDGNDFLLCVVPQPYLSIAAVENRQIRFGVKALSAMKLIMDRKQWKVGLINRHEKIETTNESCLPTAKCIGDQIFNPLYNECIDPTCSSRFFYTLNKATKVCELSIFLPITVFTAIGVILGLEFISRRFRRRLIERSCPMSN